jgi:DNA-directed RNA polymerase subunit beta'
VSGIRTMPLSFLNCRKNEFEQIEEGITFREESDEQTGYSEKVIIDTRDKTKNPVIRLLTDKTKR